MLMILLPPQSLPPLFKPFCSSTEMFPPFPPSSPSFSCSVTLLPLFSSTALFSLSLPDLNPSVFPLLLYPHLSSRPLSFSSPCSPPSVLGSPSSYFSHTPTTPLSLHIPQILPGVLPLFPTLPYVPVAIPQAVGCGGRWLAG